MKKNKMGKVCSTNGESRGTYRILVGKSEGRTPLGRPSRRWRIILKWVFDKWNGAWTGSIFLGTGTGGGLL
jgi:hypothetical protein